MSTTFPTSAKGVPSPAIPFITPCTILRYELYSVISKHSADEDAVNLGVESIILKYFKPP